MRGNRTAEKSMGTAKGMVDNVDRKGKESRIDPSCKGPNAMLLIARTSCSS